MTSYNADSTSEREPSVVAMPCGKALEQRHYLTRGGVRVQRSIHEVADGPAAVACLRRALDSRRGVLLSSTFEYPGRYRRYDIGFVNPPVMITARAGVVEMRALNARGRILLPELQRALTEIAGQRSGPVTMLDTTADSIQIATPEPGQDDGDFPEEQRSRQSVVFSVLRALLDHFHSAEDARLGLYGAFGYDLAFQFEAIQRYQQREDSQRDLVLYLPDEILVLDHYASSARLHRYDFVCGTAADVQDEQRTALPRRATTGGLRRHGSVLPFVPALHAPRDCDHQPGEYADTVRRAHEYFRRGDLFEVVPGQVFFEPCKDLPSQVFERLQASNPAPYGAMMNLSEDEYLLAASPEMYVRVEGRRVETCPISGTIARGQDAIADAQQIRTLLNSVKDEAELSMCTDVDRNDKSRVCGPGSVRVIGRRQVELYSRLIHTVDHVEGTLLPHCDALDAFLSHAWAVTVTGAPKQSAIQLIEQIEKSPRRWYGGAMGMIGFDGNMNTGLTLRAARISKGIAEVRAGATLLSDSDPLAEEAETRLKASAVLAAVRGSVADAGPGSHGGPHAPAGKPVLRALMVDHRDSFVHTLAAYFRQQGVQLETRRPQAARTLLQTQDVDLVILSPGPGRPDDFGMRETLALCEARGVPVFGVCLGLQGMVEYFGGDLGVLAEPMHGKPSVVNHDGSELFRGIPVSFTAGRYHSLHARRLPDCLQATAVSDDGIVMAISHRTLPMLGLQFHPESILSMEQEVGLRLVANAVQYALSRALPSSRMPCQQVDADPLPMQSATQ